MHLQTRSSTYRYKGQSQSLSEEYLYLCTFVNLHRVSSGTAAGSVLTEITSVGATVRGDRMRGYQDPAWDYAARLTFPLSHDDVQSSARTPWCPAYR